MQRNEKEKIAEGHSPESLNKLGEEALRKEIEDVNERNSAIHLTVLEILGLLVY
jgi:hypothetical protein